MEMEALRRRKPHNDLPETQSCYLYALANNPDLLRTFSFVLLQQFLKSNAPTLFQFFLDTARSKRTDNDPAAARLLERRVCLWICDMVFETDNKV
jgi:hypothetical protein